MCPHSMVETVDGSNVRVAGTFGWQERVGVAGSRRGSKQKHGQQKQGQPCPNGQETHNGQEILGGVAQLVRAAES
jgi:hypothetical protein